VFGGGAVVEAEGAGDDRRRGLEHELAERCCPCLGERDAEFVELSAEPDGHKGLADALAGEQPLAARIGGGVHVHAVGGQFGEHRGERFGDWSRRVAQPDEDLAVVKDSTYTVGRRGVAGNFFVIKAVGAASEQGADLDELLRIGTKVNSVTRTMGMALTSCTPPAKGSPLFELGDDEMEMGVGIHGEPGRRREKLASANEIVDELLEAVVTDLPFAAGDDVALMVNGLGGTPISELYLLYGYAHELLAQRGINVRRNYVGNYCTSLDMAGTSITLSRLDPEIEGLLAAPAEIAIRTF
jgi:dihydroxyacetone kinase